ncbi:unnamed protein product [Ilex paraguariensis]|uniref:Uncharacterized protein n=1 Tax=Ilex paraguariensis TaxID=185542 RepID=A0ABC8T8X1_9AQUA
MGFRKIDPDQWEFGNEEFIRGQRHLLKNIHRRKPIHSHSAQGNSSGPLTDSERREFEEEIQRLKRDKSLLQLELQKHEKENQVILLAERLQSVEQRQRKLSAFLSQMLKKPGFASILMQQSEINSKKRRLLVSKYFNDEVNMGEYQIVTFEKDNPHATSTPLSNLELIEKLDSSLNFLENFLHGVGKKTSADEVYPQPSPVVITEMHASSGDSDMNIQPCEPDGIPSSPQSRDIQSSLEAAGSSNYSDSPAISSMYLNEDAKPKSLGIDVNIRPDNVLDVDALKDPVEGTTAPAVIMEVNDVFWQQFLTENPGASDTQEVQSERRDINGIKSESKSLDSRRFWWNMNNVDNLADQMAHLT